MSSHPVQPEDFEPQSLDLAQFLDAAEQTGLVTALTRQVLRLAVHQARAWTDAGHAISVSVNLSARNLRDTTLVDDVSEALRTARLPATSLTLEITEITETAVMTDPERSVQVLEALHSMGVQVSVDDYGTAHSSLGYLRRLPVGELKIDRWFVTELVTEPADAAIVQSTIELAHRLGLTVVAEGVEDAVTLARLVEWGCDTVQGFQPGRPVPAAELSSRMGAVVPVRRRPDAGEVAVAVPPPRSQVHALTPHGVGEEPLLGGWSSHEPGRAADA